jgi:hypothetical protein
LEEPFDFFEKILPAVTARPLNSDVVELRHCHLAQIDYLDFTTWASVILNDAWPNFQKKIKAGYPEVRDLSKYAWDQFMVPEFALGLLEIFATHRGHCDFERFPLQIAYDLSAAASVLRRVPSNPSLPRLAIVIVAFKDAEHLDKLVEALHMVHHYIIIHLERLTPSSFTDQAYKIASKYLNVVVVKFGTVTYRTDSVSFINYQIMNWLVNDLLLDYDYHLTLGGAVYPLYNAKELALRLKQNHRDIWLGELLQNGMLLKDEAEQAQFHYLIRKRLIFTSGETKYQQRTKKYAQSGFEPIVPGFIQTNMTKKTNSGNQAIFSYKFVRQLTLSAQVKELFAIAKYGCCCCLEERTWIAAAGMIGYRDVALEQASMWQVWGGETTCQSSMNNAILTVNASICYKNEDATEIRQQTGQNHRSTKEEPVYIKGDKVLDALKDAKRRGFMFARKFKSDDASSMDLLRMIQQELHHV